MTHKYKTGSTSLFINFGPLYEPITNLAKRLHVPATSVIRTLFGLSLKAYEDNLDLTVDRIRRSCRVPDEPADPSKL